MGFSGVNREQSGRSLAVETWERFVKDRLEIWEWPAEGDASLALLQCTTDLFLHSLYK
jgi:hypothetical protein